MYCSEVSNNRVLTFLVTSIQAPLESNKITVDKWPC